MMTTAEELGLMQQEIRRLIRRLEDEYGAARAFAVTVHLAKAMAEIDGLRKSE